MSIRRWDPFKQLEALQEDMTRLFHETTGSGRRELVAQRAWAPVVDVMQDEEKIVVCAEIPGMKKEDIDIELTGDTLTIKGERKFENEEKKENFVRIERSYGSFQRSFTLGVPVKSNEVKASYKEGVLEVTIPKAEEIKPKKVDIALE